MIEIIDKLQDTIDKGRCIDTIDDEIGKELLKLSVEILDKYNNQPNLKCERTDCSGRIGDSKVFKQLQGFKSAWEELMEILDCDTLYELAFKKAQDLEQKYNLGGE